MSSPARLSLALLALAGPVSAATHELAKRLLILAICRAHAS